MEEVLDDFLHITKDFVAAAPDNPRKLPAEELADRHRKKGGRAVVIEEAAQAVKYAEEKAGEYDLILFAGSLYMIGEVRGLLHE